MSIIKTMLRFEDDLGIHFLRRLNFLLLLAWAVMLTVPGLFQVSQVYEIYDVLAPEWVWAVVAWLLVISAVITLYYRTWLRWTLLLWISWFAFATMVFLAGNWHTMGWPIMAAWTCVLGSVYVDLHREGWLTG